MRSVLVILMLVLSGCGLAPIQGKPDHMDYVGIDPDYASIPACSAVTIVAPGSKKSGPQYAIECHVR